MVGCHVVIMCVGEGRKSEQQTVAVVDDSIKLIGERVQMKLLANEWCYPRRRGPWLMRISWWRYTVWRIPLCAMKMCPSVTTWWLICVLISFSFFRAGNNHNESSFCGGSVNNKRSAVSDNGMTTISSTNCSSSNQVTTSAAMAATKKMHAPSERRFTGTPLRIPLQRSCSSPAGTFGE